VNSRPGAGNRSGPAGGGRNGGGTHATAAKSGGLARSGAFDPAHPAQPNGLNAQSVATLVAQLPKPSAGAGPSISYTAPIFTGACILGDLGSAAWNISHRDADGRLRTWGSGLYVSSTPTNALAVMRHSPAVAHYCPKGSTPLPGFNRAGTVTIAVVCPDVHSPRAWWTVFERADRLTYLVIATSDSSRAETVATGTAVFRALTQMTPRINIKLAVFKPGA